MRKISLILIVIVLVTVNINAQFSQYWTAKTFFNPSFSGEVNTLRLSGISRVQWLGVEGAPKNVFISADMPISFLNLNHGVGITVFSEKIGLFDNSAIGGQYTFKKDLFGGSLNFGFEVCIGNLGFDASRIYIPEGEHSEANDPAKPTQEIKEMTKDFHIGVSWIKPSYYVGVSVKHLFNPKYQPEENITIVKSREFYFIAGYNIKLQNSLYEVEPMIMGSTDFNLYEFEVTGKLTYDKRFSGGVSWRPQDAIIVFAAARFDKVQIGYAYDITLSTMRYVGKGSHEISLNYNFPSNLFGAKKRVVHKSVRLL